MTGMAVELDGQLLTTWDGFHDAFYDSFGFPGYYGRNMDAWIDCMSYLDAADDNDSKTGVSPGARIKIKIVNSRVLEKNAPDIASALIDCTEFVNKRFNDANTFTKIELAFDEKGDTQ